MSVSFNVLSCDTCHTYKVFDSNEEATEYASENRWKFKEMTPNIGDPWFRHYCPKCQKKDKDSNQS